MRLPLHALVLPIVLTASATAQSPLVTSSSAHARQHAASRPSKAAPAKPYVKAAAQTGSSALPPIPHGAALLAGGSDACATPDAIAGPGPFAFDNSAATTGTQGQNEALCSFFGSTSVPSDVWFTWTAGFTGNAELASCGHAVDTKIAVYPGAGCPTGPALACNDDFCGASGYQSRVLFPVVSGNAYTLQIGLYPFTTLGGAGTFTIQAVTPPANDDCATPTAIAGLGTFAFDNQHATTGTTGQGEPACSAAGSTVVAQDVWFDWTAPVTGTVVLDTCGNALDTKVAVYAGGGCPAAPALACNDDACGFQSRLAWSATSGQVYSIQIGLYPFGAAGGAGTFDIGLPPANDACGSLLSISGTGTFAFDSGLATTGPEGQAEALCSFFGSSAIANDLWFAWTAPFSGTASLSTCAASIDTKLAVYAGAGCPTAPALVCDDDTCALQSAVAWAVAAGQTYTIQVGTYPSASGGPGTFDLVQALAPPNDDCGNAALISGPGPHPFDNAFATTGTPGQTNANCLFFGSTAIASDLWFTWTAGASGTHRLALCGQTGVDTKVAVYAGSGCPVGSALACNDDRCGLASELCFEALAGQPYTIQVGRHPSGGAAGGSGTFTITAQPPAGSNDDCNSALAISGPGPHAYDNSTATTSCQGQDQPACLSFGTTAIDRDLWFTWTAPAGGRFEVATCGLAGAADTRVAVYNGAGCPLLQAIACDDDGCGAVGGASRACFSAVGGQSYTLQVGSFPGAAGGPGAFAISAVAAPAECQHDNGTSEDSIGLVAGGELAWLQRFGALGTTTTVTSIASAFGTPQFPGVAPAPGTAVVAALWDDPNDDGDPADAVLLAQVAGVVSNVDNDVLDVFPLGAPAVVSGTFFVGVGLSHTSTQRAAPLDRNACPSASAGRAWAVGSSGGPLNYASLASNSLPPVDVDAVGLGGVWLLRADCAGAVGAGYCFGDGSGTACPCGNNGATGNGCANSVNPAGAHLGASGSPSLSNDTLALLGSGMGANATCLYFQGTTQVSAVFGDGLRCAGGSVVRLGTKVNSGGASQYPAGADLSISARSATYVPPQPIDAGASRTYQAWYRNAVAFCTSATYNLTNGVLVVWQP